MTMGSNPRSPTHEIRALQIRPPCQVTRKRMKKEKEEKEKEARMTSVRGVHVLTSHWHVGPPDNGKQEARGVGGVHLDLVHRHGQELLDAHCRAALSARMQAAPPAHHAVVPVVCTPPTVSSGTRRKGAQFNRFHILPCSVPDWYIKLIIVWSLSWFSLK